MTIGITQRVEKIDSYNETRDCLDQNWFLLLEKLKINFVTIPNSLKNLEKYLIVNKIKGFILSGGNDISGLDFSNNSSLDRDKTENLILKYAYKKKLPVLGICRGFQMINIFCKGGLIITKNHVRAQTKVVCLNDDKIFSNYTSIMCYHNYSINKSNIGENLEVLLTSEDECIEASKHNTLPWYGIMWHPERSSPFNTYDLKLFKEIFK